MAEDDSRRDEEEMNEDNDAREEDIVADEDSDTRDIEDTARENADRNEARFSSIEATLDKILGQLSSIREAQGILVENGAVVQESDAEVDYTDTDSFVPPAELDLLI